MAIDLGFLGKGKDHELSQEAKVSMMFGTLYGERQNGKLMAPGLVHKIDGIYGVKKDENGKDVQAKMAMGVADVIPILEHDQGLLAKQVIAICRILDLDPKKLAEYSNDAKANLEYDSQTGKHIEEIIAQEKLNNEAKASEEKSNATSENHPT